MQSSIYTDNIQVYKVGTEEQKAAEFQNQNAQKRTRCKLQTRTHTQKYGRTHTHTQHTFGGRALSLLGGLFWLTGWLSRSALDTASATRAARS